MSTKECIRTIRDGRNRMKIIMIVIFIFIIGIDFSDENLNFSEIIPESCTVFTASVGDTVLFGNNEDVGDRNATVWFVPATGNNYGWVYFGFQNYPIRNGHFPMGGMNDQGLCFDITSIPESVMRPHPEKSWPLSAGVFGEGILRTCKTVEEIVPLIEQYDLSSLGDVQFLFADRTGDSIVLCPGSNGEMKVIQKEGVYQVITNFNVLRRQLGGYPCWRYINASEMLAKIEREDDLTVEYVAEILKTASTEGTTYSTIYDPVHGVIYFYNKHNFDEVVVFNLKDQLEKGYHTYSVRTLFPEKGESFKEPESEVPEKIKESEETAPGSSITPFGPFSVFVYVIPTAVLVMLILVHKKVKKVKKE